MSYQINYIDPILASDRSLSCSAKMILARLGGITKRWSTQCWITNETIESECGLGHTAVNRAIQELITKSILSKSFSLAGGKKIRYLSYIYVCESTQSGFSESTQSGEQKYAKRTIESTQSGFSTYTENKNMREGKERVSVTPSVSHTFDEVFVLFKTNAKELSTDYPRIQEMDLNLIAKKYFNFREEQKWKGVKNLNLNINSWLLSEIEHDKQPTSKVKPDFFNNLNKIFEMKSPETLAEPQEKIIDVEASIVD